MLLLRTEKLPDGVEWSYEWKFDGYRALAIKAAGPVKLRSRNDKDFNARYPLMVKALASMRDDTVIDGEVVALDEKGRPSFNSLQNYGSASSAVHFFMFDLLVLQGRDVMGMRAVHCERDDRAFPGRSADDAQRIDRRQKLVCMGTERLLMFPNARSPDPLDIVQRCPKPDRLHNRRRARLEPMRRMVVRHSLPRDFLDHLAATLVRRQLLKEFSLAVERPDSRPGGYRGGTDSLHRAEGHQRARCRHALAGPDQQR